MTNQQKNQLYLHTRGNQSEIEIKIFLIASKIKNRDMSTDMKDLHTKLQKVKKT